MTEYRTKVISAGPIEERSARFSLDRSGVHYERTEPMQDYMQELREVQCRQNIGRI